MGFKTFTCFICGEQITKPHSYAVSGKGRACRKHDEVQEAYKNRMEEDKVKKEQRIEFVMNRLNLKKQEQEKKKNKAKTAAAPMKIDVGVYEFHSED